MEPLEENKKLCRGCQTAKSLSEFYLLRSGATDGHCKKCASKRATSSRAKAIAEGRLVRRGEHARRKANNSVVVPFVPSVRLNFLRDQKQCRNCKQTKNVKEFSVRKGKSWRSSECKGCASIRSRDWYQLNSEISCKKNPVNVIRARVLLKLGSRCANPFCLVPGGCTDTRALHIDHVNNDGGEERKKYGNSIGPRGGQQPMSRGKMNTIYTLALNDTEGRYQLLCANCNVIKEYERRKEKHRQRREKALAAS